MKRSLRPTLRLTSAFVCVALVSPFLARGDGEPGRADPQPAEAKADRLVGTWRLVSTRYADDRQLTPFRKDFVQLKHVTPGHFVWVTYDAEGKQVRRAGGGTCTLSGDDYTEQLEYGLGEDVLPLLGKSTTFKAKLDRDEWRLSGTLSNGMNLEEVWERDKSTPPRDPAGDTNNTGKAAGGHE